ncbi:beta-lactamase family protein [Nocardia huaxiensis]|uniref:Beta-lactamase family protein n=1 Tax=Nocardia huaxiensis TaxID=2755382 RepID=A0A7D6VA64_9NOCA|nr:serine hydrolase domain-containing protein [Nocardia huaxiensis]QLY30111.1 beta-lactamase family protein [Nocardia huaxiensis]
MPGQRLSFGGGVEGIVAALNDFGVRIRRAGLLLVLAALVLVTGCGATNRVPAKAFPVDVIATIDRIMQSGIDAGLIPGAAVSIIDPERGTFSRAYGFADAETGRRADVRDRYRVGSITKTFTATAVLRLAEEGRLSLDDHLSGYVDGIPNGDIITLRQLLAMRGGVHDYSRDPEFRPQLDAHVPDRPWTVEDTLRVIRSHPEQAKQPDTATDYSNSEYVLLGLVLEKVTGRPVRDVINSLAGEYGLTATEYPGDASLSGPSSRGYGFVDDVRTEVTERTPPALWGAAGSLTATVTDLADYARPLAQGYLLRPETQQARTTFVTGTAFGAPLDYGLGLQREGTWLGHGGSVLGYSAMAFHQPDRKVSIAVTVNQNTPLYGALLPVTAGSIWWELADALYPDTFPDREVTAAAPLPAIPAPADLDSQLDQALDPAVPVSAKQLRVQGDEKDPELLTTLARGYVKYATTVNVVKTVEGAGRLRVVTTATSPAGPAPMIVTLVPVDGAWRLSNAWVCLQLAGLGEQSPACA